MTMVLFCLFIYFFLGGGIFHDHGDDDNDDTNTTPTGRPNLQPRAAKNNCAHLWGQIVGNQVFRQISADEPNSYRSEF